MVSAKLTQAYIDGLKAKPKRYSVQDTEVRGLNLTVTPTGHKSFSWYGRSQRHPKRVTIGSYPPVTLDRARTLARRILADVHEGKPAALPEKPKPGLTLGAVFEWWFKNYAVPKTADPNKRRRKFDNSFNDWRELVLSEVSPKMVDERHAVIGKTRGKIAANEAMGMLQQIYVCARDKHGWIGRNPVEGLVYFPKNARERFLLADEIPRFFAALEKYHKRDARDWILLCLWTGARKGNVASMEWSEIQGDIWEIPPHKAKQRKSIRIPLASQALAILETRRGEHPRWVLPSNTSRSGHYEGSRHSLAAIKVEAKLDDIRMHDLRRTLGSWQAMQNTSLHIIGRSLGHADVRSTQVYARMTMDPIRAAVESATAAIEAASKNSKNSGK